MLRLRFFYCIILTMCPLKWLRIWLKKSKEPPFNNDFGSNVPQTFIPNLPTFAALSVTKTCFLGALLTIWWEGAPKNFKGQEFEPWVGSQDVRESWLFKEEHTHIAAKNTTAAKLFWSRPFFCSIMCRKYLAVSFPSTGLRLSNPSMKTGSLCMRYWS